MDVAPQQNQTPLADNDCDEVMMRQMRDADADAIVDHIPAVMKRYRRCLQEAREWLSAFERKKRQRSDSDDAIAVSDTEHKQQHDSNEVPLAAVPQMLSTSLQHPDGCTSSCLPDDQAWLASLLAKRLPPKPKDFYERYRRVLKIGEGTFGDVFLAFDHESKQYVTLKRFKMVIHSLDRRHWGVHMSLLHEVQLLSLIQHENIIPLIDYHFLENGHCVLIMPVVAHDVTGILRSWRRHSVEYHLPVRQNGRLPIGYVKCILVQLLSALKYLHRYGVWHRDIKTSNLMLHHDGRLVLIDFGWGRFEPYHPTFNDSNDTATNSSNADGKPVMVGGGGGGSSSSSVSQNNQGSVHSGMHPLLTGPPCSLNYRPPEIIIGGGWTRMYNGTHLDMWAVGCVAFELVTGNLLVPGRVTELEALQQLVDVLGPPASDLDIYYRTSSGGEPERVATLKECASRKKPDGAVGFQLKKLLDVAEGVDDADLRATSSEDSAFDFVSKVLRWNPRDRYSARRLSNHPWLQSSSRIPPCEREDMELPPNNTYDYIIKQFRQDSK